jgi:hypothetical protein
MKIHVEVDCGIIKASAILVEKHCNDNEFFDSLLKVQKFNHTKLPTPQICEVLFSKTAMDIYIKPYKSVNPFSAAIGYAEGNVIYANIRKLDSIDLYERIQNIYHEYCHLAGFSHDGNRPTPYNLGSVPYLAGRLFAEYVKQKIDKQLVPNSALN